MADTFFITLAEVLGCEDTGTGKAAENTQIIDEHQLVDDGYPRHLLRADLPDHDIVQHIDKIGDAVLDHDRDGNRKQPPVECPVAKIFISKLLSLHQFILSYFLEIKRRTDVFRLSYHLTLKLLFNQLIFTELHRSEVCRK